MRKKLTDKEIAATILDKLGRKGKWGGAYTPYDSVVGWILRRIVRNGRRVRKILNSLIKDGFLLTKKQGKVVSLNPTKKAKILSMIKMYLTFRGLI